MRDEIAGKLRKTVETECDEFFKQITTPKAEK